MLKEIEKRIYLRKKRALRVRKKLRTVSSRFRLSVSKTNQHIYAQIIDDRKGETLVSYGTQTKGCSAKRNKEGAKVIGSQIAEKAKEKNIKTVVFDRGRHKYHGVIAELVNAAREAGLQV